MKTMKATTIRALLTGATALVLVSAFAPAAWAGCGVDALKKPASWRQGSDDTALLMPVNLGGSSIVGMWSVSFLAGGNQIDFGYQVWHGDGTEFTNSGGRAPSTQNFCLGVWERTGPFSYRLNHFALSYDTSGTLNARVNIKENVVVDKKGDNFTGPFTIDVYDPNTSALLQHVAGTINGERVKVD
jgi:hypothetical protein